MPTAAGPSVFGQELKFMPGRLFFPVMGTAGGTEVLRELEPQRELRSSEGGREGQSLHGAEQDYVPLNSGQKFQVPTTECTEEYKGEIDWKPPAV